MRQLRLLLITLVLGLLLSSCGAIPTLPPLNATVTIKTPRATSLPVLPTETWQVVTQEVTQTPVESPPAPPETATASPQPSETALPPSETAVPTATIAPSETPKPTNTAEPTPTQTATTLPYSLQMMNPHYLMNFAHQELGCDWLGVAGQVFDSQGQVQKDLVIRAGGELDGVPVIEEMTIPLAEPEFDLAYGPGGFELTLANAPGASDSSLWIQLFNMTGDPLSDKIYLVTYDDCQKNLILINFVEE